MILDSLKLKFEKQTSFAILPDITVNQNAIVASTFQAHEEKMNVFRYKSKKTPFVGVGQSMNYLKCGINKNGIFISYHKIYSQHEQQGITPGMIMRIVLERSDGLNDAMKILETSPHAENSAYLVCSADRFAVFQTAGGINKVIFPQKYFLTLSNHFFSEDLKPYDIRDQLFPQNTSVQRDAHVAYYIMHARRKNDIDTVKRILRHEESDISSAKGDFKTKYSLFYEYGTPNMFVTLGPPQESKYKKIKL